MPKRHSSPTRTKSQTQCRRKGGSGSDCSGTQHAHATNSPPPKRCIARSIAQRPALRGTEHSEPRQGRMQQPNHRFRKGGCCVFFVRLAPMKTVLRTPELARRLSAIGGPFRLVLLKRELRTPKWLRCPCCGLRGAVSVCVTVDV